MRGGEGDRTMYFAPTGYKQGVWRRSSRDRDGTVELMCPGVVKWKANRQRLQWDFFPGKWNGYHQKAAKLSKVQASLGLHTIKIPH